MRRKERCVELTFYGLFQQLRNVFLPVLLCRSYRQSLVHDHADRKFIHYSVDTQYRQSAALSHCPNCLPQGISSIGFHSQSLLHPIVFVLQPCPVCFHAHSTDAGIRAASAGHVL